MSKIKKGAKIYVAEGPQQGQKGIVTQIQRIFDRAGKERRMKRTRNETAEYILDLYQSAILESQKYCLGCAKGEQVIIPRRSGVVGMAAVHSSGLICIPITIQALVTEAHNKNVEA